MRQLARLCFVLLLWLPHVEAVEIAGVTLPDKVQLHTDSVALELNGAGIRSKFFMNIYVGALYLPQPANSTDAILAMPGAKRVSMHILYSELSQEKLAAAWTEGFAGNTTPEQYTALQARIDSFNALFPTLRKGDRVDIDIHPEHGTQVWLNDKQLGAIDGADFANAVLSIWLGDKPADKSLKQGLLGN